MRTGLTKQEKTTDIWFDEKDPLIHIRTHNTDLKKRLAVYAGQHPDQCRQTDTDPETGCMEFEIRKGRFSFRLTAPYSEERREAARRYARENNAADRLKCCRLVHSFVLYFSQATERQLEICKKEEHNYVVYVRNRKAYHTALQQFFFGGIL